MKTPRFEQTALSLALGASLALSGGFASVAYAAWNVTCDKENHVCTANSGENATNAFNLYTDNGTNAGLGTLDDLAAGTESTFNLNGITGTAGVHGILISNAHEELSVHDFVINININNTVFDPSSAQTPTYWAGLQISGAPNTRGVEGTYDFSGSTINVTANDFSNSGTGNKILVLAGAAIGESGAQVTLGDINLITSGITSNSVRTESTTEGNIRLQGLAVAGSYGDVGGTITAGNVTLTSEDSTVGKVFGVFNQGYANLTVKDIYVSVTNTTSEDFIIGYRYIKNGTPTEENYNPTTNIGSITLVVSGGEDSSSVIGYDSHATAGWSPTVTIGEAGNTGDVISVSVSRLNVDSADHSETTTSDYVRAVDKWDEGLLTINGNVTLNVDSISDGHIQAVLCANGSLILNGDINLTIKDIYDASEDEANVSGLWVGSGHNSNKDLSHDEGYYTTSDTSGPADVLVSGTVNVTYIADSQADDYQHFSQNIFGVAVTAFAYNTTVETGDVNVTIAGDAQNIGLADHSIYGAILAVEDASYAEKGSQATLKTGTRTLTFGTDDTTFDSSSDDPFQTSFANFDKLVVKENSALYITAEQNSRLVGDLDIFDLADTDAIDSTDVYGSDNLNGIWSRGGVLSLAAADGDIPESAMEIESGAQADIAIIQNSGTITVDGDLTTYSDSITIGGEEYTGFNKNTITGSGTLTLKANDAAGTFVNTGTIEIPTFTLGKDAALDVQEGAVTVKTKADLTEAGFMAVAAGAAAEMNVSGDINAQISVLGKMTIGEPDSFAWADEALKAASLDADANILALKSLVTTESTGYISVGGGSSVLSSASASPGLNFGSDSVLLVDAGLLTADSTSSSAFTTTASGAAVAVADGGKVVLYGNVSQGRYNITSGYEYSGVEGWYKPDEDTESTQVYVVDPSGVEWKYYRGTETVDDKDYVFIDVLAHEPVIDEYPDVNIPNIADDDLNDCKDGDYVCGILRDPDLSNDEKTTIINSSSTLLFAGGVTAVARNDAGTAMDHLYNHLTMDSDTFNKDGKLWTWEESDNIWIDVMGGWSKAKRIFNATGVGDFGYRNHSFGIITGWDHKFEDRPFALGVAVSFDKGSLKSHGAAVSPTKNEYKTYGVHVFGNYSPDSYLNLIGSLHWLHNNANVKQSTGAADFASAEAGIHTNTYAAGLRAETTIKAGDINIIPHVEARYMYGKTGDFNTRVNGSKLWKTKANGTHSVQIPVGIAFRGDKLCDNGWNFRPNLDLQVIPQVGHTKQKTVVTNANGISDVIVGQFAGKFAGTARLGIQADKKNATIGAHYTFMGGAKGQSGHTFMFQGRARF